MKRGIIIGTGLALLTLILGCGSREPIEETTESGENQFAIIMGQLNVERPTMAVYRSVIEQLTRYFDQKGFKKKFDLTKEDATAIDQLLVGLDRVSRAPRIDEVRNNYFNTFADASHLDGCLLFRDAVRALTAELTDAPATNTPEHQAYQLELAKHLFSWVTRQVSTQSKQGSFKTWPAHEVLRIGAGDPEDRLRVFLTLIHQSPHDLDGCAILVKRQERQEGQIVTRHVPVLAGVLVGKSVHLLDPARGVPVPGPNGQGVATLEQVRQTPDLLKGMPEAPTGPQLAEAEVVLLAGLSGMAPRMRELQKEMELLNNRVKLTEELVARLKRFHDAGVQAKPWADPSRPGFPALTTYRFVEGSKGDPRTAIVVRRDKLVPPWAIEADKTIVGSGLGGVGLLTDFDRQFIALRLEPGGGRDLLVRGNATQAVAKLSQSENLLERSIDALVRGGDEGLNQIRQITVPTLERLSQSIRVLEAQLAQTPAGSPERAQVDRHYNEARRAYDSIWRESRIRNDIMNLNRAWAMPELREHYTYFMGLAKLELALQAERRYRRNPSAAWPEDLPLPGDQFASAAEWFRRYEALVIPTGTGIWLDAVLERRKFCDQKAEELRSISVSKS